MNTYTVPHLCGGILFDLLLEARKPRRKARSSLSGKADGLSNTSLYAGLAEIVTKENPSNFSGGTIQKCVSNYKKCESSRGAYVPFTDRAIRLSFDAECNKKSPAVLKRTAGFIEKYLNENKCIWLARVLIEVIEEDESIRKDRKIDVDYGKAVPVSSLHKVQTIRFLPFFASVLHYVFTECPDCESGRPTFEAWYSQVGRKAEWKLREEVKEHLGEKAMGVDISMDLTLPEKLDEKGEGKKHKGTSQIILFRTRSA